METLLKFMDNYGLVIDLVYKVIMIFIFGFGLYSILFQKKGLQYSTIKDCIDIHRSILRSQQRLKINKITKPEKHKILIKDHLGLVTDELFYMKNGYLPENISKDWLRHMVNFVPIQCNGQIINEKEIFESREISEYIELDKKNKGKQNIYYADYLSLVQTGGSFNKIRNTFIIKDTLCDSLTESLKTENKQEFINYIWKKIKNGTQQKI